MATTSLLSIFKAAREWLSVKEHWTKGYYFKSKSGSYVTATSTNIASTCLLGACYKVAGGFDMVEEEAIRKALKAAIPKEHQASVGYGVVAYNDQPSTTHEDILGVLNRAIEQQQKVEAA